jgi:hypothetical protein
LPGAATHGWPQIKETTNTASVAFADGNSPPISREDMAISKKHLMAAAGFA